ncbi:MAG TPA: hypothetical protein VGR89_09400, partial [Puia sp.]|nr:hypothetical protein [Puia sp.]
PATGQGLAPATGQGLAPATGQGPLPAVAQGPVLGVYFSAGTIQYLPARNGAARPLTIHTWLSDGDRVSLQDNISELILFDRDSDYIRLDGKGSYTVADLEKMPRMHVSDSLTLRYFSLLWAEAPHSSPHTAAAREKTSPGVAGVRHHSATLMPETPVMVGPRHGYTTSLDSLIFRWHQISWAQKYFLRIRNPAGELLYDSVLVDTGAVVHFAGLMPPDTYHWALDLVGASGRLQFGDSSHFQVIDESSVLPQLPPLQVDSLGGISTILRRIGQYEASGCLHHASDLFRKLTTDFPDDAALDKMYQEFLQRNCLR